MTKKQTTIITALSVIAIILAILVSTRFWVRLDFTKNKAYTISKVSRNLYLEIQEPVNITYYLSNRLRSISPITGEIEDTLREYTAYSRGKIRLTVRDPVKEGLTAMIEGIGLQALPISIVEEDQDSYATVYSGIVIEYLDKIDVIPVVGDTSTLEYDLTTRIRALVTNTERHIGVIVGDSFRAWDQDFRYLAMTFYGTGYRVRTFNPGEEIPDHLPGLFVFGGVEDLDDEALYRIDRYIQTGGKVLFAAKGVYIDTQYGTIQARDQQSLGLLEMIASYGVTVKPCLALDKNALFLRYETRSEYGMRQLRVTRYPLWIGVAPDNGNLQHPITSNFSGLDLYWASPLEVNPPSSVNAEVLFTTSQEGWLQRDGFITSPEIPYMLEREANETKGAKILGASLTGVFPNFFEHPDISYARPSRIIVIGEVDFATNFMAETEALRNLDFLVRAADWLTNDDDIISIRNRQPQAGHLDKIADPANRRAAMRFSQILNVVVVPAFVIAAALIFASKRKRRIKNDV